MMALNKRMLEREPGEIELLLPWHAAGTLNARDARRVEDALARNPEMARQYAAIREEYAETIGLNETLGAPSGLAMQKLFAAIDAEPARKPSAFARLSTRISGFLAGLSPRALAWCGGVAAFALVAQGAVIGTMLAVDKPSPQPPLRTASFAARQSVTRSLGEVSTPRVLVRFAPEAHIADITALLDRYRAAIIDVKGGMFRLQFGDNAMSAHQADAVIGRLQNEKIVSQAEAAQ